MSASTPILSGVSKIADNYDIFLLDVWGVLHNGLTPYSGTLKCLENLKEQGKTICLVSNTCNREKQLENDLLKFGIPPRLYDGIFTAGSTCYDEAKHFDGQSCWFIGHQTFLSLLDGYQVLVNDSPYGSDFIVNAISGLYPADHTPIYKQLDQALELKLPMLCANPDLIVHIGDDLLECAGTFAQYYEDNGGKVIWCGKPYNPIYKAAWEFSGQPDKSRMVAIGDSIRTDIQGANKFGIDSVFNLVGIHREEILCDQLHDIDENKLAAMLQEQEFQPTAVLNGFEW